jgi:3-hydroxyisobutyrate dehydrogenase-like beta-hydroxyacid dehydrogenase
MSEERRAPSERIGFVGVGRMGSAMLQKVLDAGYRATLCDPSEQATAPFVAALPDRVRVAPTAREAAQEADVVEVVVNTNEQLLDACLAPDGVLAGMRPDSILLIHSTVSHETLRRLASEASKRGVHLLDAMVSGAMGQHSVGNLAVMVGGDAEAFARAKPVMETYGSMVLHLGPQGAGLDAKLAINMFRYLCMAASQEATRFAESTGVGAVMAQLVGHTESNRYTGDLAKLLGAMANGQQQRRETDAELCQKDLRAALARAVEVGLQLPSAECAVGLMHRLWGVEPQSGAGLHTEHRSG